MKSLARRFETLRWRLILSCFVAAFTAMIALEGTFVIVPGLITYFTPHRPIVLVQSLQKVAPQIAPDLRQTPSNQAKLTAALASYSQPILVSEGLTDNLRNGLSITPGKNAAVFVIGRDGEVLASLMPTDKDYSNLARVRQLPEAQAVIAAALRNTTNTSALIQSSSAEQTVAAAPIVDTDGTMRGALLLGVDFSALLLPVLLLNLVGLLPSIVIFGFIASIFGAIFGMLTARGLTRRLLRLTSAADTWSQGDFAAAVHDPSSDELGQLARDLNRMAEQLQNLLRDQQQLAVFEERNRLARELHDSVKQQMFALTMLVGSAQLEVEEHSEAKRILSEAERISSNAQQEMSALIQALRPVALANKDLGTAIRELCGDWEQRHGIACAVDMPSAVTMASEAEQQVFRIVQEALANVAKHSGATRVEVHATDQQGTLALRIRDNGHGFAVAQANGRGMGLSNMRERIEGLGGTLHIDSAAGGTRIEMRVPLAGIAPTPDASQSEA